MKTLVVNRSIIVSIFVVMMLIYGLQDVSYGQGKAPTVTPAETNTALKVSFTDFLFNYDENAYQVQLRRKSPQGEWITRCSSVKIGGGTSSFFGLLWSSSSGNYVISAAFTDLEPGVTYEVRYRDTNLSKCHANPPSPDPWSAIGEGTTHLVAPPRVEFVDANLAEVVRRTLDLDTTGRHIDLLKIPEAALAQLRHLEYNAEYNASERFRISNLTGLELATQLTTLSLINNNLHDLTPLAQLTQLTELNLSSNAITDVTPLTQLTQLMDLRLGNNNISNLTPLAQLTQLMELNLSSNAITDVTPLTQLTQLMDLRLGNNNISNLTPLAQLTQLRELDLSFNAITDVTPLTRFKSLDNLFLSGNDLSDLIPLAQLPQRTTIRFFDLFEDPVAAGDIELITASTPQPLTEATLNGSIVTLTLLPSGAAYGTSIDNIRNALTVSGIDGVTISDVIRVSDTELKVTLDFTGDLDSQTKLTFSVNSGAVPGYNGRALTGEIPVSAEIGLTASTNYPLTAVTLNGAIVTLMLTSGIYEKYAFNIEDAVTISGITGITFGVYEGTWGWKANEVRRVSDTEITIELKFTGNINVDSTLMITIGSDAIADYNGPARTIEIPVSASTEVEVTGDLVASTAFPLTKATLNGSIVKLTLKNNSYAGRTHDYDEPIVGVSGIPNVKTEELPSGTYLWILSSTEIWVRLHFTGNLDTDTTLTFIVPSGMIENYDGPPLAATLPVTVKMGKQVLVSETSRPSMYWINTDTNKIESLDRFDVITNQVKSLTVDAADGKVYWSEHSNSGGIIKRANLDGTNVEMLTTQLTTPQSITIDTVRKRLYWIDTLEGKIQSADLNGENIKTIIKRDDNVVDIDVDADGGKLYWADLYSIWRVNLDGTNVETPLSGWGTRQTKGIGGITVVDGKIYWTEHLIWYRTSGNIHRANLNGTDIETLATPLGTPNSIAVDTATNKVYWANSLGGIQRTDLNSDEVEVVVSGITAPGDFVLVPGTQQTTPTPTPTTTDTAVSISPTSVESPQVGEQITFNLNIAGGEAIVGYQATVQFDTTALRYVESSNGDYLPDGAFFAPPVMDGNLVKLNAASLAGATNGDGTLATLTFEVIAVKASTLTLSDILLSDSAGETFVPQVENAEITESQQLSGDVNGDGTVNIADLVLVASNLGKTGQNAADVNGDGVVNIADLVLVAGALGSTATAPSLHLQSVGTLPAVDVQQWLSEAQQLNLTDAASQRGIQFLEQLLAALTPKETALLANYPNPFNPETWIPYHLAKDADVTLTIYAIDGQVVRTLALGHQPAGMYQARSRAAYWDGRNAFGEPVASGVYFYTLTAGDFTATRKMLIRK